MHGTTSDQLRGNISGSLRRPWILSGTVRRDSAASPAVRGEQWQLGCGAQPRFPGMDFSRRGFPVPRGPCGPVSWRSRRGSVGERSAGLGGGEPRDIFECEAEPEHFMNGLI